MTEPTMNYIPAPPTTDLLAFGDPVVHNVTKRFGVVMKTEMNGDQQVVTVALVNALRPDKMLSSSVTKVEDPYIRIGELESQVTALMFDGANVARAVGELRARLKESRDDVDYLEARRDRLLRKVKKLKAAAPRKKELRRLRADAAWVANGDTDRAEHIVNYALHGLAIPRSVEQPKTGKLMSGVVLTLGPGETYESLGPFRYRNESTKEEVVFVGQIKSGSSSITTHYVTRHGRRVLRRDVSRHYTYIGQEPSNGEG